MYTPDLGYAGPDMRTYQESAGPALSNVATVTLDDEVQPPGLVINLNDAGPGSLRKAIQQANAGFTQAITCRTGLAGTISLQSALPPITSTVTITGTGMNNLYLVRSTAPGTGEFGIFTIQATCSISALNIVNGSVVASWATIYRPYRG